MDTKAMFIAGVILLVAVLAIITLIDEYRKGK